MQIQNQAQIQNQFQVQIQKQVHPQNQIRIFANKSFAIGFCCFVVSIFYSCSGPKKNTITIACSANMQHALLELVESFEAKTEIKCQLVVGSSGKLTAQIIEGAPYDIFLSADSKFPLKLYEAGKVIEKPKTYAMGRLAIWSSIHDTISIDQLMDHELIEKIAIANPKTAPYGEAAMQFLTNSGILEDVQEKLVYGESVGQVNQFISSGAVSVGVTAKSTIIELNHKEGYSWINIDTALHEPIVQQYVVIRHKRIGEADVRKLEEFILSDESKAILLKWGYLLP